MLVSGGGGGESRPEPFGSFWNKLLLPPSSRSGIASTPLPATDMDSYWTLFLGEADYKIIKCIGPLRLDLGTLVKLTRFGKGEK